MTPRRVHGLAPHIIVEEAEVLGLDPDALEYCLQLSDADWYALMDDMEVPQNPYDEDAFDEYWSFHAARGHAAATVVIEALRRGRYPIPDDWQ